MAVRHVNFKRGGAIKIEHGVPIPPHGNMGHARSKYPWAEMKVGDSFFAPVKRTTLASAATDAGKRLGWKFKTAHEGSGSRVWRVS